VPDHGHELQFGYFLNPEASDPAGLLDLARSLEDLGYDLIGIQDHPYQPRFLDTFSLMSFILAQTGRVRLFPAVANLALRPPAMLAKAAASLDLMSGGRFELGLGSGAFRDAVAAMGGPRWTPAEALNALREAIDVIRAMWSGQRSVKYSGSDYRLAGLHPGPPPAHRIGIWLGVGGSQSLQLVGRAADGWVSPMMSYTPPAVAIALNAEIDEAAREAGRDPAAVRRIYIVVGGFTPAAARAASDEDDAIVGPPDHWISVLEHLAIDLGFDSLVLAARPDPKTLKTFIGEVAPAVRERVAARRARLRSAPAR
jgi:alkanesulfonate monooxygenase SsuD/methylene tetrahydromethanopterin reductase-like flavin-dependent oxidoreductase (luciferase family)